MQNNLHSYKFNEETVSGNCKELLPVDRMNKPSISYICFGKNFLLQWFLSRITLSNCMYKTSLYPLCWLLLCFCLELKGNDLLRGVHKLLSITEKQQPWISVTYNLQTVRVFLVSIATLTDFVQLVLLMNCISHDIVVHITSSAQWNTTKVRLDTISSIILSMDALIFLLNLERLVSFAKGYICNNNVECEIFRKLIKWHFFFSNNENTSFSCKFPILMWFFRDIAQLCRLMVPRHSTLGLIFTTTWIHDFSVSYSF